jgi:hypothetical protein
MTLLEPLDPDEEGIIYLHSLRTMVTIYQLTWQYSKDLNLQEHHSEKPKILHVDSVLIFLIAKKLTI